MEKKILRIIAISFYISIYFSANNTKACGWIENSETVRLALFKAEVTGMSVFRPFYYSAITFNTVFPDPEGLDQSKNCLEWQKKLGHDIDLEDIRLVLYHTEPGIFENARKDGKLAELFPGNTFINKLLIKKNRSFFEYLAFAKEMEYINSESFTKWENWNGVSNWKSFEDQLGESLQKKSYSDYLARLPEIKDVFLQQRYAFLFLRLYSQAHESQEVIKLYDTYFAGKKTDSIIAIWALLFDAMAIDNLDDKVKSNYLYSLVFDQSDEKKFIAIQCFNNSPEMLRKTLDQTTSSYEKAVVLAMAEFRNPGPSLSNLKVIDSLAPNCKYLAPLIMREINKLEDWIFTPKFTSDGPSVCIEKFQDWEYSKIREKNYQMDMAYLTDLIGFVTKMHNKNFGETKDFFSISLAHLWFINDNVKEGKKYLAEIPATANSEILLQKSIDVALVTIKSEDLTNEEVKNNLFHCIQNLETIAKTNFDTYKTIYSLLRLVGGAYEKINDYATAGLLFMHSEINKNSFGGSDNMDAEYQPYYDYYWNIAYFDRYATVQDMDKLIQMVEKKQKSPFEAYLCKLSVGKVDAYKDLKGTIAFRNNDLELAAATFSEIPSSFWAKTYEFSYYLNNNPYVPKCWVSADVIIPAYTFNKAQFIKELIALRKEAGLRRSNQAEVYLKLGHAFYNCSYWGNSWMMTNYGKSSNDAWGGYTSYIFGNNYEKMKTGQSGNYYNCTLAVQYYQKALSTATNKEQKAIATLMLHECYYNQFIANQLDSDNNETVAFVPDMYLKNFYTTYLHTKAFRELHCSLLDDFIGYKD